ncbi:unnamed protein product [Rhodiola kirilowii]
MEIGEFSKHKSLGSTPIQHKKGMFSKLWSVNKSASIKNE